jgi:hypothetical protein
VLGGDVWQLELPEAEAAALRLAPPVTYASALQAVVEAGDRGKARRFVGAILRLRNDERIQGEELEGGAGR